jgi:hypothetical protein
MPACQNGVVTFLDQALAGARDSGEAGAQRVHDAAVAPTLACLGHIGLQQDASLHDRGGRVLALADQRLQRRAFVFARTIYFLTLTSDMSASPHH